MWAWKESQDAERDDGGCSAEADHERGPVRPAYVPAAAGEGRCNTVPDYLAYTTLYNSLMS